MAIRNSRTMHQTNPIGFMMAQPTLTWELAPPEGAEVLATRVVVRRSGEVVHDSGASKLLPQTGYLVPMDLEPRTRYTWTVEARYADGRTETSEPAWFETGKLEEPWVGRWITSELVTHPRFRKTVNVREGLEAARLYVTALGLYEVELGGEKVGDEYLTPNVNNYDHWIQYQSYDVTEMLRPGEVDLTAIVGNGWYKGRFGFDADVDRLYGDTSALLGELHLRYSDGSEEVVGTDSTWSVEASGIVESSIYDGETVDQRQSSDAPLGEAVLYDHPYSRVVERLSPPVMKQECLSPTLLHTPRDEQVLDWGQNMTGWVELYVDLPEGQEVSLAFGEILQEDCFYRDNLRSAKAEFHYISDGVARWVRPHFTFYGFRYTRVEGVAVKPEAFRAYVLHSEMPQTGTITTSHPKVNQLIHNALWGQKGNFLDVPTDCPQRDERMGWTGDAQVFARTASFNMDTAAFYRKYLYDMQLEQKELGGSVPHVVPDAISAVHRRTGGNWSENHGSCAWADAAAVIPWVLYTQYGDLSMLASQYANIKMWVDYQRRKDRLHGDQGLITTGFHFADWLALDNPDPSSPLGRTDAYYVASAYYYYSTTILVKAAQALGYTDDVTRYATLAERILAAIRARYFDASGKCLEETQTACVLGIYFGLAPELAVVRDQLRALLDANGGKLTTGFVGTAYLCLALSEVGLDEYAYDLLLNEAYPGWLYEVNMGATTVWERWNSVLPDGSVSDTGMNSLNHYAYGVIVEWIYRVACGLNPDEANPGFKRAILRPVADPRLSFVEASYDSAYGRYTSGWRYESDGTLTYHVVVPAGAAACFEANLAEGATLNGETLTHAGGRFRMELSAGDYCFKTLA